MAALGPGAAVLSLKGFPWAPQTWHTLAFPRFLQWLQPDPSVGLHLPGHLLNVAVFSASPSLPAFTFSCMRLFHSHGFADHLEKGWPPNLYNLPRSLLNYAPRVQWPINNSNSIVTPSLISSSFCIFYFCGWYQNPLSCPSHRLGVSSSTPPTLIPDSQFTSTFCWSYLLRVP